MLRNASVIAVVTVVLAACQTFGLGRANLISSTVTAELPTGAVAAIAGDIVGQLKGSVGPGATTIRLKGDGSAFGVALEQSLRSTGYAVANSMGTGAGVIDLAYVVDEFEGNVLVRLSTTSLDLTRIYRVDGETAVPVSPISVMTRGDEAGT